MYRIKACGNTRAEDVRVADECGADYVGVVVEVAVSKRSVSGETAATLFDAARNARKAMLVFDPGPARLRELVEMTSPDAVHFIGEESPSLVSELHGYFNGEILKSIHLPPAGGTVPPLDEAIGLIGRYADAGADMVVIDTRDAARGLYGGTGKTSDWTAAAEIVSRSPLPVLMAGGINIDNVERAIEQVNPLGVDLASGLECEIGIKDHELVRRFITKVKSIRP